MKGQKTAIVVTECRYIQPSDKYARSSIVLPISRIAKVEEWNNVGSFLKDNRPSARLTLRTPEDYINVAESVERVAALMNGEG